MNHRQCIFGIPAELDPFSLCEVIAEAMYGYDCSDFSSLFIACDDNRCIRASGMRLFIIGSADREWYLDREEFEEAFSLNQELPLITLLHDDEDRIYTFKEMLEGENTKFLMSNGPYLSGDLDSIYIEYSQKSFTNDELSSFYQRDRSELTEKEQRAIFDFDNAIDISLRQWYPAIEWPDHLNLLSTRDTFSLIGSEIGSPIRRPRIWNNTFHYSPNDADWSRSDLSNPHYDNVYEEFEFL